MYILAHVCANHVPLNRYLLCVALPSPDATYHQLGGGKVPCEIYLDSTTIGNRTNTLGNRATIKNMFCSIHQVRAVPTALP